MTKLRFKNNFDFEIADFRKIFENITEKENTNFTSESENDTLELAVESENDTLELAVESINEVNSGGSRNKKPNKKKNTPNRKKYTNKIKAHKTYNRTKRKTIK